MEPSADYCYDATYRLIEATGREHLGQMNGQPNAPTAPDALNQFHIGLAHPGDSHAMGRYLERYVYGPATHAEYLALFGEAALAEARRRGRELVS